MTEENTDFIEEDSIPAEPSGWDDEIGVPRDAEDNNAEDSEESEGEEEEETTEEDSEETEEESSEDETEEDETEDETEEDEDETEDEEAEENEAEDPLKIRQKQLSDARKKLEYDEKEKAKEEERSKKSSLDNSSFTKFIDRFDLSSTKFPHPVNDGETVSAEEIQSEFPGITEYTQSLIGAVVGDYEKKMADLQGKLENMELLSEVRVVHPDVSKLFSDAKFDAWLNEQAEEVSTLVDYGESSDVVLVLNSYKKSIETPKPKVSTKKAASRRRAPTKTKRKIVPGRTNRKAIDDVQDGWDLERSV